MIKVIRGKAMYMAHHEMLVFFVNMGIDLLPITAAEWDDFMQHIWLVDGPEPDA